MTVVAIAIGLALGVLGALVVFVYVRARTNAEEIRRRTERIEQLERRRAMESGSPAGPDGPPLPPPTLLEAFLDEECVLFAGGELDLMPRIRPTAYVLRALLSRNAQNLPGPIVDGLEGRLREGRSELVAEVLASEVSPSEIAAALLVTEPRAAAAGQRLEPLPAVLSELPFSGVVTDLWAGLGPVFGDRDPIAVTPYEAEPIGIQAMLRSNVFFVAHLHGVAEQPETLRIGWQAYREGQRENREFERFLASVLSSRSLLFLAADVDLIERLFSTLNMTRRDSSNHFALVSWSPDFQLQAHALRDRFGVHLLPLRPGEERGDTLRFLEALRIEVGGRRKRPRRPEPLRPPRLEAIELENIGPFESLSLPLQPRATVLLGDNGSGKSSVLRAIALALSGEGPEVDRAAAGLLRVGASSGNIELRLEGESHRTTLRREGAGVSVLSRLSPVAEGLWLGLGFPPLRGVPDGALEGPKAESVVDPTVDDIIPLADNGVDTRFGDLQQWVVNAALRAGSGSASADVSKRMLDTFFAIVSDLTPGVRLEFAGIDEERWRVMVNTQDGTLSLEQLSRGMTAVFSWVGVLLGRLFQIYGDRMAEPQSQPVLVLVDEIDLHLHPDWQRRILPLVLRHFPNIQLVASTHSPLVVGSTAEAGFVHLQRGDGEIESEVLGEGFSGWRSDQILTGPAFDLSTTRDQVTEGRLAEYTELLSGGLEDDGERRRAEELASQLRTQMPGPEETESGREAARLVRDAIHRQLREVPSERREALLKEADAYLRDLQGKRGDG